MNIGILGSGDVGRRLGDGFIELGHKVKIGSRDPNKSDIAQWVSSHGTNEGKASSGTFAEAASFAELAVLATSWDGIPNAIKIADQKNFAGKIVIDVTNPLDFSKGVPPRLAVGYTDSGGETVQRLIPQAKVVKTLNIVGNPHMVHPDFPGGPPTMFVCGNDDDAKKIVTDKILTPFGWETVDIGGLEGSRLLEPLAMLWISHYFRTNNGNHAFKLLRK
ncbi:MAG TPA: NAD(P)-binding domain-containing protein [Nitrososphaeraceae archaeon]|jgi:8-hydroxy-5-deazaflavin:NADPH oxidoreductase|nr:NAD(P)-binding domain-containing protein [Nitrososphaeraceae archaeon]